MTGYGRAEAPLGARGDRVAAVELSGVNRKQTDIAVNLPSQLSALEPELRKRLAASVSRGRITARVTVGPAGGGGSGGDKSLRFDRELAGQYLDALRSMALDSAAEIRAGDLLRAPGVFQLEEADAAPDEILPELLDVVDAAVLALVKMQQAEGENLRADLAKRLDSIAATAAEISARAPQVLVGHRQNLHQRLSKAGLELGADSESLLDDERIAREIALFADRCDISEELTRIDSHLQQFRGYLGSGGGTDADASTKTEAETETEAVGRPLDFLCQEFNREFNTIGAKANDAEIARHVVALKTELEKIREQVQNVQ